MKLREISPEEAQPFEEYSDKEWEHGGIVAPVTKLDIEMPAPKDMVKTTFFVEVDGKIAAGLGIRFSEKTKKGFYGIIDFLDMWVAAEYRGQVEHKIITECDTLVKEQGAEVMNTRIPEYTSRFTRIFEEAGYTEDYKEETFVRDVEIPIDDVTRSYYEKAKEKVHFRISKNLKEDIQLYVDLLNEISQDVENIYPLEYEYLYSELFGGIKNKMGVWIFAEVDTVPAGYIIGEIYFQKFMGKKRNVGRITNNGVLKRFRGMGIGTALYVRMIEEMRKWGVKKLVDYMVLEDNIPEKTLLGELGFEFVQKHVKMHKDL